MSHRAGGSVNVEGTVELRPHIGLMAAPRNDPAGRRVIEVEHDQWLVFLNGRQVGILGKSPGCGVCFISRYDAELTEYVRAEAERLAGHPVDKIAQPATDGAEFFGVAETEDDDEEDGTDG